MHYWGLGNEMYGGWQIGNLNAHDYVKKARAFAMVMKRTDPTIELIGCGQNGWSEWDEIVLGGLAEFIDYHCIHLYTGSRRPLRDRVLSRTRPSARSGSARR